MEGRLQAKEEGDYEAKDLAQISSLLSITVTEKESIVFYGNGSTSRV